MIFTTITDNQQTVKIHVLQGERQVASQNKSLGYFNLVGIPLAPKGIPQIEVTFEIDANGIVRVSAKDKQTGLSQGMKIQPSSGLSPEEIDKKIIEAKKFEDEDKQAVIMNRIRLQLEEELDAVRFFFDRHEEKFKLKEKSEIRSLIAKAENVLKENDLRALENTFGKTQALRTRINKMLISEFED
jgi:molecular chaperone DnaK